MANEGFEYREQVQVSGDPVVTHLARRYPHSSAEVWRARVEAGEVVVDGLTAEPEQKLRAGQLLTWRRPPWEEPRVPLSFGVLYRDDHLLAVAKPSGLPCVPNGGFLAHTLLQQVRHREPEAVPLHRLGRATSGIVLFALSVRARREGAAAWREGRVAKIYRALICGVPAAPSFRVAFPIGPVPHPVLGSVHAAVAEGRPACSEVRVLETRADRSVVEVRLLSGRPHQIRIHLAAAGHPLVGDLLYAAGGGLREDPALPGEGGYWLHAHRLELAHPVLGRQLRIECLPPPVLRVADAAGAAGGTRSPDADAEGSERCC